MPPYTTNLEHLRHEFRRLDWLLDRAIQQVRVQRNQSQPAEFQGLYISDDEIDTLISEEDEQQRKTWTEAQIKVMGLYQEIQQRVAETQTTDITLRLPYLQKVFDLSLFETDLLLLAIAPEIDLRYQRLYAYLQDDVTRKRPSVELALRLFCCSLAERVRARAAFIPDSPLLDYHLLLLHEDPIDRPSPLLSRSLKLDNRITEFLLENDLLDSRLCFPLPIAQQLLPQHDLNSLVLPQTVRATLQKIVSLEINNSSLLCLLVGAAGVGKKACAAAVAQARNQPLLVLDLPAMLDSEQPFSTLLAIAFREAQLYQSIVYLERWDKLLTDEPKYQNVIKLSEHQIKRFKGFVFVASRVSWQPKYSHHYQFIQIKLPLPDQSSRLLLWQNYLNQKHNVSSEINLNYLANAFRFSGGQIQSAIAHATSHAHLNQSSNYTLQTEDLLEGCRFESSRYLVTFARKLNPKRRWQDLVLPKDILAQLREMCQQVRYRSRVYTDWGFEQRLSLGKGVIALFTGNSGTGKTLSAEIIAKELELDIYKVDLSLVVSKYIGETEKNLSRLFEEAQGSNAILFFDEADALFGKRSDIKDAHDRYANIEINYLLQKVEEYEGVIILASNFSKNIDEAFVRRLHFSVEFPFPDEQHRLKIWQDIFPSLSPLAEDIDFEFLARKFKIAGGNIKNVALSAAFRAAEDNETIQMKHLILAMKREYQKLGKVCEPSEFEKYYELVIYNS